MSFSFIIGLPAVIAHAATVPCSLEDSFDSDGFADLAIGVPGETVDGDSDAGAVAVLYGAADGIASRDQFWHQDSSGVGGAAEPGDGFGAAVAKGDFDGNGFADLAVGAPGENEGAGMVHVLYGTSDGLRATGSSVIGQSSSGVAGTPEAGDGFGSALAVGNFDGDAYDDLVVGVPGEGLRGATQAGVVVVVNGATGGLDTGTARTIAQGADGIPGAPEDFERFGVALAACDFDGDDAFDLAIGSSESFAGATFAGKVNVLEGPALSGPGQVLTQTVKETGDRFGSALAAGDFDGDTVGDLAVGAPGEGVNGNPDQGVVQIFSGSESGGLGRAGTWHQASPSVDGAGKAYEYFGFALAAGDFDASGHDELAVGVPGDYLGKGSVALFFGSATEGITASGDRLYSQDSSGVPGGGERGDQWGSAVAMLSADADGTADLAVGAADENIEAVDDGAVTVLYGGAVPSRLFHQDTAGIRDTSQRDDLFGFSVA